MKNSIWISALGFVFLWMVFSAFADGPRDNDPLKVRQVPKQGVEVPQEELKELEAGLLELQSRLKKLNAIKDPAILKLIPDVEIFYRAVRGAIDHREFFRTRDIVLGKRVLMEGLTRAELLLKKESPWTTQTGPVVRGYRSKLDDTVQPYGVEIPESYSPQNNGSQYRCDLWLHGRGELSCEIHFIGQRMSRAGRIKPPRTIVVHPYGRYSNAFKFAGEIDVLEVMESVKENYPIDEERTSVRGFSMGGAGCWQLAAHYPSRFFAANPGGGFSETPEFLKSFQAETLKPTWYEKRLWQMYDCPGYVMNFKHCPVVAYSGEFDTQKQACDIMETAFEKEGMKMLHLIGLGVKHKIAPDSAIEIEKRMTQLARNGRNRVPKNLQFATYTLKYNRMHWLQVDGMVEHWEQARVYAAIEKEENTLYMVAKNVSAMTFDFESGDVPFNLKHPVVIRINGVKLEATKPLSDYSWTCSIQLKNGAWQIKPSDSSETTRLEKKKNLQGPIDDALMSRFIFVEPTGKCANETVEKWTQSELKRAKAQWRQQFRGDVRTVKDDQLTFKEIEESNLILWGDPSSNVVLKKVIDKLPISWSKTELKVGDKTYDAKHHAPILIFPNPLNPKKYVVLNSSFTYREYAYLNNARQVPMLPDWAIVDLRTPAGPQFPGEIVDANFFDEQWRLKK